jgi:hydrogenase maturation protease
MDVALAGQTAIIEAIEQDMEKRIHLALVLENDPGKDLGMLRQPGHRFFYGLDEVEPLVEELT